MRIGTHGPVRLLMATPVVAVDPTASLRAAAVVLGAEDIGAVVVQGTGGLDGVLSERDIVRALAAGADPDEAPVAGAVAGDPLCVDVETPVAEVIGLMLETGIRHVPVVAGREAVGMVSIRDVLDVVVSELPG
ncbi:MAG TPA: CBS domain-containing protein [Acidimicrobiales bacterium]|nr:CBS domain-containing protein [Acidimicrobiales bacterium]